MEISVDQLEELYPDFSEDQIQELYDRMHGDIPYQTPLSYPETQGVQPSLPDVPSDGITGGTEEVDAMDLVNPQSSKTGNVHAQTPQNSEPPTGVQLPSSDQTPDDKQKQIDAYIAKYGLDKYFPDRRASLVSKVQEANSPPNIVAGLGALGAGLAGFNPIREGLHILDHQKAANESNVTAFDQGRKSSLENMELHKSVGSDIGENDLNSPQSRIGQNFLIKAGMKPELAKTVTAAQFKNFSPAYLKMYEQQQANYRSKLQSDGAQKSVSSSTASQIGEYDAALKLIDDLESSYIKNASQTGSSVGRWINGTQANQYMDQVKLTAQNVGRVLENGKLTDADYDRYVDRLALPSDTNAKAKNKFNQLREQIKIKRDATINAQGQAGYSSKNFNKSSSPQTDDLIEQLRAKAKNGDSEAKDYLDSIGEKY